MEESLLRTSSSPTKRQRLSFDSDVEVMSVDEEWGADPLLVKEEVRRAIQQHLNGNSEAYDRMKDLFRANVNSEDAPSPNVVKVHLQAVLANISLLDKNCSGLVNALCQTEWVGKDAQFISLYTKFLGNLGAAQSGYLSKIFAMLVDVLAEFKTRRVPGFPVVRRPLMHGRAHMAIQYLLQLIPIGSSMLSRVLSRRLQYTFDPENLESDVVLTKNALRILEYAPELKSDVLATVTSELVKVDVQVQVDLEDLDGDVEDELLQDVTLRSGLKHISSQKLHDDTLPEENVNSEPEEEDSEEDEEPSAYELRLRSVKANIEKVDSIIDLLFQFYDPLLLSTTDAREDAIELLLSHFHNIILPTYRSRHTQFLVFHFTQTDTLLVDRYATSCIQLIFDKRQPAVLRQSAAAYLASFVARGAHVPAAIVRDVFDLLGSQLETMRKDNEPSCRGPDLRRYSSFYSMTQALLYIFCFRWQDLSTQAAEDDFSDSEDEEKVTFPHAVREPLYQAVFSKLNPLRICSPSIVNEFARIAHHLNFMYVYTKLELNKNVRLSSYRSIVPTDASITQPDRDSTMLNQNNILEPYFPFDPYTLPRSKRWIEGDYVEWKGIPGLDDKDDTMESESESADPLREDDDVEDTYEATGTDDDEQ